MEGDAVSGVEGRAGLGRRLSLVMVLVASLLLAGLARVGAAEATTGTAWTWGLNQVGELGDGSTVNATTPVGALPGVTAVAGGYGHSLALLANGHVAAWGNGEYGQLGTKTSLTTCGMAMTPCATSPVSVSGLSNVVAIAAGINFSLALLSNGTVWSWGDNSYGELGYGSIFGPINCGGVNCSPTPVEVYGLSNVKAIAAGGHHALALLDNGTVMVWGANNTGQLGLGTDSGPETCASAVCSGVPVLLSSPSGGPYTHVTAIAAGDGFSLALVTYSVTEILAWGSNRYGQLGQGTVSGPQTCGTAGSCSTSPVLVTGLSGTETAIAANGDAHQALALEPDGAVAAWGKNGSGEAGGACGAPTCPAPKLVPGVSDAVAIAASANTGTGRSVALEADGQVVEWGGTPLGNGTYPGNSSTPVNVTGMDAASAIAAGGYQSLAVAPPPTGRFGLRYFRCQCGAVLKIRIPFPGLLAIHQFGTPSPGPLAGLGALAIPARRGPKALINPVRKFETRAGLVTVRLKLTAAGKRALNRRHRLRIKVRITFTPTGGRPAGKTITVTVIKRG